MVNWNGLREEPKYNYSNETDEHKYTKQDILRNLQRNDPIDELYVREEFDDFDVNRIPDIGGVHKGKQLAVEVVHLNEDYNEYYKKVKEYHKNKIYDMWIYTSERMHEYVCENNPPSDMMQDLLKRYGCIYYYQVNKLCRMNYIDGEWNESAITLDITWDNLCFAELKYQKYCCVEQKYEVDWLVAETEEFVNYRKQELEQANKEITDLPQEGSKKEGVSFFRFKLGVPVRVTFVECNYNPETHYDEIILDMGDCLVRCAKHKNLIDKLNGHEGEECVITLFSERSETDNQYRYRVEF